MKKQVIGLAIAIMSMLVLSPNASAVVIVNGGFETGDYTGWSTIGRSVIRDSSYGSGPTEGTYDALLSTRNVSTVLPVPAASIESFLGLAPGTLDSLSPSGATAIEGSAIKQTFAAMAGEVIYFDYNFLTNEYPVDIDEIANIDYAFVSISSQSVIADVNNPRVSSPTVFNFETGFNTYSHTFGADGNYTLGIGILDVGDANEGSGLLVDNVRGTQNNVIPEPATGLLFALAMVGGGFFRRFKK